MIITIAALRRALQEAAETEPMHHSDVSALEWCVNSPEILVPLAERLNAALTPKPERG